MGAAYPVELLEFAFDTYKSKFFRVVFFPESQTTASVLQTTNQFPLELHLVI